MLTFKIIHLKIKGNWFHRQTTSLKLAPHNIAEIIGGIETERLLVKTMLQQNKTVESTVLLLLKEKLDFLN